ncbi:MAG: hypothetical protein JWN86_3148 [Planctomycetota bacterium]|nr:hypothetical protein [Planctomycetota bacterium]
MQVWQAIRGFSGLIVAAIIVVPMLSVPLGAIVDSGPDGSARATAFHVALTASDHTAREALGNSLILATGVAALAMLIGILLAGFLANRRFPGRDIVLPFAGASGAIPPLFAAMGLSSVSRFVPVEWDTTWRWLALVWVELAWAVPRVMATTILVFEQLSPAWQDAARLAGAGRRRAWWSVVWPLARPRVAQAVAEIFALTLFEPGGPLALGVRGTLGFRIVEAVLGIDQLGRAAALGTIGLALALSGRSLILWWGGPSWPLASSGRSHRPQRTSLVGMAISICGVLGWVIVSLVPTIALAGMAVGLDRSGHLTLDAFIGMTSDRQTLAFLGHGLLLGLAATLFGGFLALCLERSGRDPSWRRPSSWSTFVPPLALGLGAVLVPRLLDATAGRITSSNLGFAQALHRAANLLDPFVSPWFVLVTVLAMLRLPALRVAIATADAIDDRDRLDVARSLGASGWTAWLDVTGPRLAPILGGAFAWSIAQAALEVGPALLLSPTLSARSIAPGVLTIASEPGGSRKAAAMAVTALLLPIAAWIVGGSHFFERTHRTRRDS